MPSTTICALTLEPPRRGRVAQRGPAQRLHRLALRTPLGRSDGHPVSMLSSRTRSKVRVSRLTRREVKSYVHVQAGAGNETTNLLIGWIGKLLGEHARTHNETSSTTVLSLPNAIEEILRSRGDRWSHPRRC